MIEKEIVDFISGVMLIPSSEIAPGEKFLILSAYDYSIMLKLLEKYETINKVNTNSDS